MARQEDERRFTADQALTDHLRDESKALIKKAKPELPGENERLVVDDENAPDHALNISAVQAAVLTRVMAANAIKEAGKDYDDNPGPAIGAKLRNAIVAAWNGTDDEKNPKQAIFKPLATDNQSSAKDRFDDLAKNETKAYFDNFSDLHAQNERTDGKQKPYFMSKQEILIARGATKFTKFDPKDVTKTEFDETSEEFKNANKQYGELLKAAEKDLEKKPEVYKALLDSLGEKAEDEKKKEKGKESSDKEPESPLSEAVAAARNALGLFMDAGSVPSSSVAVKGKKSLKR